MGKIIARLGQVVACIGIASMVLIVMVCATLGTASAAGNQKISPLTRSNCTPQLTSVSSFAAEQTQNVRIKGSCFGVDNTFSNADSPYFALRINASSEWNACYTGDSPPDFVTCTVSSWTDNSITFSGFNGDYGQNSWVVNPGDDITIEVWNPQTGQGPGTCTVLAGVPETTQCNKSGNPDYYYAGSWQFFTANGASGNFNQDMPKISPKNHSLAELAVESADGKQIVEVGWIIDPRINGDNNPHLFVFHWVNGKGTCYNACGYVQVSKNFKPGDKVAVDSKPNVTHQYAIEFFKGNWWIGYESKWIGYFPGTLWNKGFTQVGLTQWFGEVEVPNSQQFPCSQMGDGLYGTSQGSAVINNMYFFVNGQSVNANAQATQPNPSYYNVGQFMGNSFTYGGPGDTQDCSSRA